jgi:antitoxin component of RelBE/YafQ-DinJ toxin-antitoxin module
MEKMNDKPASLSKDEIDPASVREARSVAESGVNDTDRPYTEKGVKELRLQFPRGEQIVRIDESRANDYDELYHRLLDAASASELACGMRVKRFVLPLSPTQISILPNGAIIVPELYASSDSAQDKPLSPAFNLAIPSDALAEVNHSLPSDMKAVMAGVDDLDTRDVAVRVHDLLATHHISQAVFSEHIVGLTQGALSNLLNKPKPWASLQTTGRQPYLRMKLWLDSDGFDKRLAALLKIQHDKRGHRKRPGPMPGSGGGAAPGQSPTKRTRHVLSEDQKKALNIMYAMSPKPTRSDICMKADELGLPSSTVVNWFHNQRAKANRLKVEASLNESQASLNESQDDSKMSRLDDEDDDDEDEGNNGMESQELRQTESKKHTPVKETVGMKQELMA